MSKTIIGVLREEKSPPDNRVPLTPLQCTQLQQQYSGIEVWVQPSENRCYSDAEYRQAGVTLAENLADCHILLGVKEVPPEKLIAGKKYLFFSHTIKKQPYNRQLLQTILQKNVQLIDYECLRYSNGKRIIGFGRFAGIVGAHNGLQAYGIKTGNFTLPAAHACKDFEEIKQVYASLKLPAMKIVLTGAGRVAWGAKEVLDLLHVEEVNPDDYCAKSFTGPVFTHLHNHHLYCHKERHDYERHDFYRHPQQYYCPFMPYAQQTDLMINGIYWNPQAPHFFTKPDMQDATFKIKVIADITCDINGSIPATIRATKIGNPVMGYNPVTGQEETPYQKHTIDIMSVDNLPNELPRDASAAFGQALLEHVFPELMQPHSDIINHASITNNGQLTPLYQYLHDYVTQSCIQ
ncbi:alanine dehydrogenase [Sphingobacteriales bacterium UPWRP_1]|nr:alanine dehydrogenase [Sphingobacteriales bacterium TSM_CSM]PSJ72138.1 alanine dehydrogenase [Sphingobacteriales bacterium UPWRP_1]